MADITTLPGLDPTSRNAFEAVQSLLSQYGLGDLAQNLLTYAQQGYDSQTSYYLLQQTPDWKARFQGNEIRRQNGMGELDPATYLDLENQYAQTLKQFGVPQGMFGRADFAQWIGGDVSPSEINGRVQMAADAVTNSDPFFKDSLAALGVDTGHLTAYYLDQNRAMPFLQRQFQASQIGAEALRQHLGMDPNTALALASMGVTQDQAKQGYAQIGAELPTMQKLAQITPGANFTQQTAEQQVLEGSAAAQQQAFKLTNTEEARFAGAGGVGTNIYHPAYGLTVPLEGQY